LGHVINLGNIDVMSHITKIVAVKNSTAIWEYNPTQTDNCVLGSSLDVIATIRTLAIKVRMSRFPKFTCQTHNAPLYSGIRTMDRIFWDYPASLWTLKPWKFLYTAMFNEEWLLTCFTRQTTFAKWVSSFFLFNLVIRHFISLSGYFWHRQTISMVPSLRYAVIIVSWSISCGLRSSWVIEIGSGWLMHATYSG